MTLILKLAQLVTIIVAIVALFTARYTNALVCFALIFIIEIFRWLLRRD